MSADEKHASEIGRAEQALAAIADNVAQKSHGGATRPAPPLLSARKSAVSLLMRGRRTRPLRFSSFRCPQP